MKNSLTLKLLCTTIATSSLIVAIPLVNTSCSKTDPFVEKVIPFELLDINNDGVLTGHGDISQYNKLLLPEGVVSIGQQAFYECSSLVLIDLSGLTTGFIDYQAFENCSSLVSIDLNGFNGSINSNAFTGCTSLLSINLSSFNNSIGITAFSSCTSLTSLNLPSLTTGSIGESAFYNCTSLTSLNLSSLTTGSIGGAAFALCSSLNTITIVLDEQPTEWDTNCFAYTSPTGTINNSGNLSANNTLAFFVSKGLSSTGWTCN